MELSFLIITVFYLFAFIFGTIIGSFINVVVYRLHHRIKGILGGRSACPHCHHLLGALDLIPIVSFFILKGKCRYCAAAISKQYPIVEALSGFVFLYIFSIILSAPALNPWQLLVYGIYAFLLLALSVYDAIYYEIPDILIVPGIVLAAVLSLAATFVPFFSSPQIINALLGVLIAVVFFGSQVFFSGETWMGWGDVLIGVFMGLVLGWQLTLVAIFLAYIIGSIAGIILILWKGKKGNSQIPFGPFLSLGTLLALGLGNNILHWYLGLLGS